jgi:hypothetical protein
MVLGCGFIFKHLNNISYRLEIFVGRIITSSAKPEKRIVAHKASIIEIVKITIEGAHEPLSSSYSSGQSIYFGFNDFRQIPV